MTSPLPSRFPSDLTWLQNMKVDEVQTLHVNSYVCKQSAGALPSVVVSWSPGVSAHLRPYVSNFDMISTLLHFRVRTLGCHAALSNLHVVC